MPDRRWYWATAVHEAAHSIAGRLMGLRCGGASIDIRQPYADVPIERDGRGVVVLMAAAIAERLLLGDCDEHGASNDCERWTALLGDRIGDDGLWWGYTARPSCSSRMWI